MQIIRHSSGIHYIDDFALREYIVELIKTVLGFEYQAGKPMDLSDVFGGDLFICEKEEDLKMIYTTKESTLPKEEQLEFTGGWASILETPDSYDSCNYILGGRYVEISLCTNNNGGNIFIVPRILADKFPNIKESIRLTTSAWENHDTTL